MYSPNTIVDSVLMLSPMVFLVYGFPCESWYCFVFALWYCVLRFSLLISIKSRPIPTIRIRAIFFLANDISARFRSWFLSELDSYFGFIRARLYDDNHHKIWCFLLVWVNLVQSISSVTWHARPYCMIKIFYIMKIILF